MPIHDWTRVDAGLFHDFRQDWTIELRRALNAGLLPSGFSALIEPNLIDEREPDTYARRANTIRIHHRRGEVVAVIEIVSPGNKSSRHALNAFVNKAATLLLQGVNLLVVDLFPPSIRDPQGIHKAILEELSDRPFSLPVDKPLTVAAYRATPTKMAYVDPLAVGGLLPSSPIFLVEGEYVSAPLEETYPNSWAVFPNALQPLLGALG
ncbi:hypothetical protein BH10PLA2_BH10PLA2_23880 [soil metagenome]